MSNPDADPQSRFYSSSIEVAAASLSVKLIATPVQDSAEIENAIAALGHDAGSSALIVLSGLFTFTHRELIARLADRYRLPAVYPYREFVDSGGLLSYGVDLAVQFRQAAAYVDRILRGEKPAELPVQAPTKFELAINRKSAKVIGLDIPLHLQQLADEVIE
jgi:putative ABC transport system substrate-binding protein